ncbi:MAG: amidohydrolase family protein [Oscillospiraceae bacterium]|nr:amidohydrolase family protein [Oscillospiraceae bacterium]
MSTLNAKDFEIIDMHAHIFPHKISEKATHSVGDFYDIKMFYAIGESEALLQAEREIGAKKMLVCSVATTAKQVTSINDFIAAECNAHPEFIGFAALHGDYENIAEEVDRVIGMGMKGIKLHPDFQRTAIDDPKAYRIYEAIEGRLPLLIHMGDYRHDFSHPTMLAQMMKDFPKLQVIASHLGGYGAWDEAEAVLHPAEQMMVDTSSSLSFMSKERALRLIHHYGVERCMFGTDFPMWSPAEEVEHHFALGLTEDAYRKIFAENAKQFMKL